MRIWTDITQNRETGHYVALDVFKAVSFWTGIWMLIFEVAAFVIWHVDVPTEPAIILLILAFGLQNSKFVQSYFARKTADGYGNALATRNSTEALPALNPELMPQSPNTHHDSTASAEAPSPPE